MVWRFRVSLMWNRLLSNIGLMTVVPSLFLHYIGGTGPTGNTFFLAQQPSVGHGLLIHEVSRSHTTIHHSPYDSSGRVISSSQTPLPDNTQHLWVQSLLIEFWLLVGEVSTLSLNLLTTQTMVTTGILPLQGNFPWLSRESNPEPRG